MLKFGAQMVLNCRRGGDSVQISNRSSTKTYCFGSGKEAVTYLETRCFAADAVVGDADVVVGGG